ncbi:rhomboid family intramembrane serine protease [Tahibacter amnicola]|uniref:rhomboid family intramembrane serine protease n=1 Tax=Tahibacter amnicola TaxID=2976241 RepID=UPI003CCD7598
MLTHVESRRRPTSPWATISIIVLSVLAFMWLAAAPLDERLALLNRWGTVPARLFDPDAPLIRQLLELRAARLFTALLVHADWLHLTGNLLFLMIFGVAAERVLGSRRFLLLYLLGGAAANLVGALTLSSVNAPIVGSSGAVSAIVGAYLALFPRSRLGLVLPLGLFLEFVKVPAPLLIGFWVLLQLLFTYVGPSFGAVVWWTHIGGFLLGVLFALVSRPAIARRWRN